MSNQSYPPGPPPVSYVDDVFTDARHADLVMHHMVKELGPVTAVALKFVFGDHSERLYNVTDPGVRIAIMGAITAALPLCTDPTRADPARGAGRQTFSAPDIHDFEVRSAPAIIAAEAILYRNALVMTLSLSDGRQDRWVFEGEILEFHASYLRLAFHRSRWTASEVNQERDAPAGT